MDKQDDRILAEAKQDKLRYLEEVHSAQRKMNDLQAHLKLLESKLADKDVEIRLLQEKKSSLFTCFTRFVCLFVFCVLFPFLINFPFAFSLFSFRHQFHSLWIIL